MFRRITTAAIAATLFASVATAQNAAALVVDGSPWGQLGSSITDAMNTAFGAGQWDLLGFGSLSGALASGQYTCMWLEGSDSTAPAMNNWLSSGSNLTDLEDWVEAGNGLFINAAPNTGGSMTWPFGLTLNYPDFSGSGTSNIAGGQAGHPIFNGPETPVGTTWTGSSFTHATVSGAMTTLGETSTGATSIGENLEGSGVMISGGMTTTNFHNPQPEAFNLRANILDYIHTFQGGGGGPGAPASSSTSLIITALVLIAGSAIFISRKS